MHVQRDFPPQVALVLEKIDIQELASRLADYENGHVYDDEAALNDPFLLAELREAVAEADAGHVSPPLNNSDELQWYLGHLRNPL